MKKIVENTTPTKKGDLITAVAELSGLSKKDSTAALEAMMHSIQKALKDGKEVSLFGFGTFGVTHRPAREGRNPRTGVTIKLAASRVPKFRASKTLKEAIA